METNKGEPLKVREAIYNLGEFGPQAYSAVPVIAKFLASNDRMIRLNAVITLGKIGADSGIAAAALVERLDDADGSIRTNAEQAIKNIGYAALPALDGEARRWHLFSNRSEIALNILRSMLPENTVWHVHKGWGRRFSSMSVTELVDILRVRRWDDFSLYQDYLREITIIGPGAYSALPVLRERMKSGSVFAPSIAECIGAVGPSAINASKELLDSLDISSAERPLEQYESPFRGALRESIVWALSSICKESPAPLIEALHHGNLAVQSGALLALERINSKVSWEAIERFWKDSGRSNPYGDINDIQRIIETYSKSSKPA